MISALNLCRLGGPRASGGKFVLRTQQEQQLQWPLCGVWGRLNFEARGPFNTACPTKKTSGVESGDQCDRSGGIGAARWVIGTCCGVWCDVVTHSKITGGLEIRIRGTGSLPPFGPQMGAVLCTLFDQVPRLNPSSFSTRRVCWQMIAHSTRIGYTEIYRYKANGSKTGVMNQNRSNMRKGWIRG